MERFSKNKSTQTVSEQLEQVKQLSNLIINMSVKYYIYTNHNDCKIHIQNSCKIWQSWAEIR